MTALPREPEARRTRLVHLSDLHFGAHEEALEIGLGACIQSLSPSVLAVTGDLTQRGTRAEFEASARFLDRFDCPKIVCPGNHDTPLLNIFYRAFAPFRRFNSSIAIDSRQIFEDDSVIISPLQTARAVQARTDWSLGVADLEEVDLIVKAFDATANNRVRIVSCHHPLMAPMNAPFPPKTLRGKEAARRLAEGKVDLVLSGHLHVRFVEQYPFAEGLTYAIGASTAMSTRTRVDPAGFNLIDVTDDGIDISFYEWSGKEYSEVGSLSLPRRVKLTL